MRGFGKAIAEIIDAVQCAGRRICSWCDKDMGPAPTKEDTHGICPDCAKKM